MTPDEIDLRFTYHAPSVEKSEAYEDIRFTARVWAQELDARLPECREKSLVITSLEEVVFWANAAIARH